MSTTGYTSGNVIPIDAKLTGRATWPEWYQAIKYHAIELNVWEKIDPMREHPEDYLQEPTSAKGSEELIAELNAQRKARRDRYDEALIIFESTEAQSRTTRSVSASASTAVSPGMPTPPSPSTLQEATFADIKERWQAGNESHTRSRLEWDRRSRSMNAISHWITGSVDQEILRPIKATLMRNNDTGVRAVLVELLNHMAPGEGTTMATARQVYRDVLSEARKGSTDRQKWYNKWRNALTSAQAYDLPETQQGFLSTLDFIDAVGEKMLPEWSREWKSRVITQQELGQPIEDLDTLGRIFQAQLQFATIDNRKGRSRELVAATIGDRGARSASSSSKEYNCPCLEKGDKHPHKPADCRRLESAVTGTTEHKLKKEIVEPEKSEIKARLRNQSWKWLVEKKGWQSHLASTSSSAKSGSSKYPGSVNAALINPDLIDIDQGVYSTWDTRRRHPLSQSTLFDNCGAMHLVNDKSRLVEGSFKKSSSDEVVECGSGALPILGKGTRVIKNLLTGKDGERTQDLILENVVMVEGFHVNIVSESAMLKSGVWFCGLDCSLKFGSLNSHVTLLSMERRFNLVFLEYKPFSTYLSSPPILNYGTILSFPTYKRSLNATFRRSRDYLKPRTDTADLWHKRAGHPSPKVLEKIVQSARNVIIEGIPTVRCESCALASAKQVISRREPHFKSPRPFWRVFWDLFDFPMAYNGASWILLIKDEYSGKLWGYVLTSKTGIDVHESIRHFENWVRRQFGLGICKLKHDQDTSVIAIQGLTQYEHWAEEEGIDLELAPSHTHEPTGSIEKAGHDVINKSIRMRLDANLPDNLWPETSSAAIYLHGMLPSEAHEYCSPNEVLYSWFRNYFRWYDPALITRTTADLRPDWNGIYAYGARAYPLKKDREAGKDKRAFKVLPRAHIGYLVGYSASNIYRVWVPQLGKVIVTRNVTFDETKFYAPDQEKLDQQPLVITQQVVELIEEPEIQDAAGGIIENLPNTGSSTEADSSAAPGDRNLGGELLSKGTESQNSGVSRETGLLTPDQTPEPATIQTGTGSSSNDLSIDLVPAAGNARAESIAQSDELAGAIGTAPSQNERHSTSNRSIPQVVIHQSEELLSLVRGERGSSDRETTTSSSRQTQRVESINSQRSTRHSKRQRGINGDERGKGRSVYYTFVTSLGSTENQLDEFFSTFWPDSTKERDQVQTMHAVIAASVLANNKSRLGKLPALDRTHQNDLPKAPRLWSDLERHPYGTHFIQDARSEIANLESRNCWRQVEISEARSKAIPLKWVFTYKVDPDGFVLRCKARIVVRGDLQEKESIISTYAATLAARSFRVAIAITAHFDLEIKQYDVVNAFINAKRDTRSNQVVCQLPPGFKKDGMCVEVDRALYGLRDSPALWYQEFSSTLKTVGLVQCKEEPCLFMDQARKIFVVFYVDDVLLLYHNDDQNLARQLMTELEVHYKFHDLEDLKWFLGMRVIRDRVHRKISLVHDTYIEKIAVKFKLDGWKCPSTPLPGRELAKNQETASPTFIRIYQEKVGSLLYTAIMIRADVAFAASQLSQFLTNPSSDHMDAVDWAIRYLWGTRFLALQYGGDSEIQLVITSDASFADDHETRRSSHGYTMSLFGGLVVWKAARQSTVTTSTTEAELLGVEQAAKETMALQRLFRDMKLMLEDPWTIFCDNQQTIRLIVGENERITTKLRHVDIQNMWLRQEHSFGTFEVTYLPTDDMPADGLTKNLPRYKFEHFRSLLNLKDVRGLIEAL